MPQLVENYRNGNADGISFLFLFVWFVGDIANLVGGVWAGLVPVVIAIAIYFTLADTVMLLSVLYYKARSARLNARRHSSVDTHDPTTPLLGRHPSDPLSSDPFSYESTTDYSTNQAVAEAALAKVVEESKSSRKAWLKNIGSVLAIFVIGTVGWTLAWQTGTWTPAPQNPDGEIHAVLGAQILGYFSAACYLGCVID